ncbi:MAG TPA: hypothetical protein DCE30_04555 [Pantoea sp.]|nr:hypothetical protein [Pantoea sp.]
MYFCTSPATLPYPIISDPGPQRVIVGQNGEAYYTNDHYKTFIKIR